MSGDRGSAGLLGLVGALLVMGTGGLCGALVAGTVAHSRVEAAADMVALGTAAVLLSEADPCATAVALAARNAVSVSDCRITGLVVSVDVTAEAPPVLRVINGQVLGSARAELRVDPDGQSDGSDSS